MDLSSSLLSESCPPPHPASAPAATSQSWAVAARASAIDTAEPMQSAGQAQSEGTRPSGEYCE